VTNEIRLFKPSVGEDELASVRAAFERGWLGLGGQVKEFEREFAQYVGSANAVALNSGTAALQLAVEAFHFKPGKKILVSNLTFVASATCILLNNLVPVLVDCDAETLGFDLLDAERKTDADTVAIVVVHYGGHPAPMDSVMEFARARNLKVIEDCAHCVGGNYGGRMLGTWGDIGCFSFEEKKGMTTGDGGMMVANDADLIEPMRANRWVGIDKDTWRRREGYTSTAAEDTRHWHYEVSVLGYKYNMNDIAASIGRVQLRRLDAFNSRRATIISRYLKRLAGVKTFKSLLPYNEKKGAYWLFGMRTPKREDVIRHLKSRRIATGVHYMPLSLHPLFSSYNRDLPVSNKIWETLLTLPLHVELTEEEIDRVAEAVGDALAETASDALTES
jgi:dTDP-4-amino-4,6-dideoxygalactose transaminase